MKDLVTPVKKHGRSITLALFVFIFVIVFMYGLYLIFSYSSSLQQSTTDLAVATSEECRTDMSARVESILNNVQILATKVEGIDDRSALSSIFESEKDKYGYSFVRYLKNGVEFTQYGSEFLGTESVAVNEVIRDGIASSSGVVYDQLTLHPYIAFYSPVSGNSALDSLVVFYSIEYTFGNLPVFDGNAVQNSEYSCICSDEGTILYEAYSDNFPISASTDLLTNVFVSLRELSNSKDAVDALKKAVLANNKGSCLVEIKGETYTVSVGCAFKSYGRIYVLNIYKAANLFVSGFTFITNVSAALAALVIVFVISLIFSFHMRNSAIKKLGEIDTVDPALGCNTYKKFSADAKQILERNKISRFYIIYCELSKFSYISESFGEMQATETLKFLAKVIGKCVSENETYGHLNDDQFVMLMHCRDDEELSGRLRVLNAIVFNYPEMKKLNYNLKITMGVCVIDRDEPANVQKLLDCAGIAQKNNVLSDDVYTMFTNEMKETYSRDAEIEAKMETSLANNEFKVFYQPKYGIAQDRVDSSEALVRWFDPKTGEFVLPAHFVPLFEANGFISRVDRYVFVEVCKYISEAVERGYRIVPVSVNVSRVTATSPGFVDFYIKTKRKYNIADRFLTIEFTESFAFENYDILKEMIDKLHENGFACSIDDFGSGYSSYNVLKELPMDELKLDRFFISKGMSEKRDDELLSAIITLAKSFGMKVVQEGVETREILEKLKGLGCDAIQGFYYSKPLPLTDYIEFVNNRGSISDI